jgi:putative transport protein
LEFGDRSCVYSACQPIGFRAYEILSNAPIGGRTIADTEKWVSGARLFVERIRRKGELISPSGTTVLEAGDTVAVLGRTEILVKVLGRLSSEVADPELLEIPVASFDLYVTQKAIAGKTLQEIADGAHEARGVLLRGITRGGHPLPIGTEVVVERGDTLHMTATEAAVGKLAPVVGMVLSPVEQSDLSTLGFAVAIGVLVGSNCYFSYRQHEAYAGNECRDSHSWTDNRMAALGKSLVRTDA